MTHDPTSPMPVTNVELQDDNLYMFRCANGHDSYIALQELKFELLFDIGACAILDGYYREAITSFHASLERFCEFFIRAVLLQRKLTPTTIDQTWKTISKQSERQLGAYTILFLSEMGVAPPMLSSDDFSLRNKVVHQGLIPSRDQALGYGQKILDVVRPALQIAKQKYAEGIQEQVFQRVIDAARRAGSPDHQSSSSIPTILSINIVDPTHHERTLNEALSDLGVWDLFGKRYSAFRH
jgi:hypothetical protein